MVQYIAMTTHESMHGFNPDEYQSGLDLRKQLAVMPHFTPEQVAFFLRIVGVRQAE